MTYTTAPASPLPDPVTQSAFYADTPIKRGIAWVIDALLILALVVPTVILTFGIGLFFLPFIFFAVGFVYRVLTIAGGSATWGMRIMSIEFRNDQGARLDFGQAVLHTLGYTLSMSIPVLQVISVVMMFLTERRQGLTDMMLGTVVLNRRL